MPRVTFSAGYTLLTVITTILVAAASIFVRSFHFLRLRDVSLPRLFKIYDYIHTLEDEVSLCLQSEPTCSRSSTRLELVFSRSERYGRQGPLLANTCISYHDILLSLISSLDRRTVSNISYPSFSLPPPPFPCLSLYDRPSGIQS